MSTVTYSQLHPSESHPTQAMVLAAADPVKNIFTQRVWPVLRMIPGYLIMTPYSATILLLVGISIGLGLEDPFFQE